MAQGKKHEGQERRPPIEAAKERLRTDEPGHGRVRGPEERTPGEDVLGEDLRAEDELLGEHRPSSDELLAAATSVAGETAADRIAAEQRERMDAMGVRQGEGEDFRGREAPRGEGSGDLTELEGVEGQRDIGGTEGPPSHGLRSAARRTHAEGLGRVPVRDDALDTGDVDEVVPAGREGASALGQQRPAADDELGPAESPDAEALERRAAWEHTPDLERVGMALERDEGAAEPLQVTKPVDLAAFDALSNAAYDETTDLLSRGELSGGEKPGEAPGPGARMDRQERTAGVKEPGPASAELEPPPGSVVEAEHARAGRTGAADEEETSRKRATTRRTRKVAGKKKGPAKAEAIKGGELAEDAEDAEAAPAKKAKKKAAGARRTSRRAESAAEAKKKTTKKKTKR